MSDVANPDFEASDCCEKDYWFREKFLPGLQTFPEKYRKPFWKMVARKSREKAMRFLHDELSLNIVVSTFIIERCFKILIDKNILPVQDDVDDISSKDADSIFKKIESIIGNNP